MQSFWTMVTGKRKDLCKVCDEWQVGSSCTKALGLIKLPYFRGSVQWRRVSFVHHGTIFFLSLTWEWIFTSNNTFYSSLNNFLFTSLELCARNILRLKTMMTLVTYFALNYTLMSFIDVQNYLLNKTKIMWTISKFMTKLHCWNCTGYEGYVEQ